jgi:hypothetical protein
MFDCCSGSRGQEFGRGRKHADGEDSLLSSTPMEQPRGMGDSFVCAR